MNRAQFIKSFTLGVSSALTGTDYGLSADDRQQKAIELLECPVAGHQYCIADLPISHLSPGMPLLLKREPSNPYDANAVAVYALDCKTGYIPREHNTLLAAMLDQGLKIEASLEAYDTTAEPWERMWITIILPL